VSSTESGRGALRWGPLPTMRPTPILPLPRNLMLFIYNEYTSIDCFRDTIVLNEIEQP
jgi:hypothetical protein